MIRKIFVCLLLAAVFSTAALASALYTEDFNGEIKVKGRHRQAESVLPLKLGKDAMDGWTRQGGMPAHFVEYAKGDWSLMLVAAKN